MSNITLSFEKDGSDRLTHNIPWGRKGTQNGVARILGYQVLFLGRLPGDHFSMVLVTFKFFKGYIKVLKSKMIFFASTKALVRVFFKYLVSILVNI